MSYRDKIPVVYQRLDTGAWMLDLTPPGRRRVRIQAEDCSTREEAEAQWKEFRRKFSKNLDPVAERREENTVPVPVKKLLTAWAKHPTKAARENTLRARGTHMKNLEPLWAKDAKGLTFSDLEEFKVKRLEDGVSRGTVSAELGALRGALNASSMKPVEIIFHNLTKSQRAILFEKNPEGIGRNVPLEELDEIFARLSGVNASLTRQVCTVIYACGARVREIGGARWSEWQDSPSGIRIQASREKGATYRPGRFIPVDAEHKPTRNFTDYLFGGDVTDKVQACFDKAAEALHVADVEAYEAARAKSELSAEALGVLAKRAARGKARVHDLRHSFGFRGAVEGASHMDLAKLMGHKNSKMVDYYYHADDSALARLVSRVAVTDAARRNGTAPAPAATTQHSAS